MISRAFLPIKPMFSRALKLVIFISVVYLRIAIYLRQRVLQSWRMKGKVKVSESNTPNTRYVNKIIFSKWTNYQ